MKKLFDFVNSIDEARRAKVDGVGVIDVMDQDEFEKSLTPAQKKELKAKAQRVKASKGEDEEDNGSHGTWAFEPPYDDDAITPIPDEKWNKNLLRLSAKFDAEEPFFIIGEAGWGKTTVIKDMAKRSGRWVITVYLDKAVATDLGGIPVPVEGKSKDGKSTASIVNAMPDWAAFMREHPEREFLLFFDEMNQAAPDVQNALMPIVLENVICNLQFNNFMVGAAGNYEHENDAVSELSGPLKSRFKPIIEWQTGDEQSWIDAMDAVKENYIHKYKIEFPKKFWDAIYSCLDCFVNPREVDHKIIKFAYRLKNGQTEKGKKLRQEAIKRYTADFILEDRLNRLAKTDKDGNLLLTPSQTKKFEKLAEEIYNYIQNEDYGKEPAKEETSKRGGRGKDMITEQDRKDILEAIKRGYMTGPVGDYDNVRYGISEENIIPFMTSGQFEDSHINAEIAERFIDKCKEDGVKFKFKTDDDWRKATYAYNSKNPSVKYLDPLEDNEDEFLKNIKK